MALEIDIRHGSTLCPSVDWPMMFVWRDNDCVAMLTAGLWRKRVKWLPAWFPFNTIWDYSPNAIAELKRRVQRIYR